MDGLENNRPPVTLTRGVGNKITYFFTISSKYVYVLVIEEIKMHYTVDRGTSL